MTDRDWYDVLVQCQVKPLIAAQWAPAFADTIKKESFSRPDEVDDFLAQILHESGMLTSLVENLNYSAERICAVWPKRFPTLESAQPYAHQPQKLANKVYAGRMGNTDINDGWNYRGRSPVMITGKDAYRKVGELMGQDLVENPELLEQPRFALEASIEWWEDRIPDSMIGHPERISRKVNGGTIGMDHRVKLAGIAERVFG